MSQGVTACPLDCFDACSIVYRDSKLSGVKSGHTQGFLCPHLNHYNEFERIISPRYKGQKISIKDALVILKEILAQSPHKEMLYYKGSGNFGLMQDVTEHFFSEFDAISTEGTLCDGAGEAGILKGRGSNQNMPLSEIAKSEVVIVWGRNPHTTSSHLLPFLKGKKLIVIDPVTTKIAKQATIHIQLKPNTDIYLAMLLMNYLEISEGLDKDFLDKYKDKYEEYCKLIKNYSNSDLLQNMDISLEKVKRVVELVNGKRVAIVCGLGIQKYKNGADVMQAIDAFALSLGLFGKEGCGVSYLGNSKEGLVSPFSSKAKRVSKVDVAFDEYKSIFIQGSNPLSQMPNTARVKETLSKVQNIVYFGLYENETSRVADLIIPAKTFLEKEDVRTSYSHNGFMVMNKQIESDIGISEYDLAKYLCLEFGIELKDEEEYLTHFKNFAQEKKDGSFEVKLRDTIQYRNGFDTKDGEFKFLQKFHIEAMRDANEMYLITPKSAKSLNSQFVREEEVFLHSKLGFKEGESVKISSAAGSVVLKVKYNDDLRKDCALVYSGTPGVNNLTSSEHSSFGKSAIYQENRVIITDII
ncbi:MAG: molybdopterin-dependent oxidoreductase [Campylobacterota bacterium]|nr:molybdopterin-dependent oxidoreductase [Campylobacterota bacterium]